MTTMTTARRQLAFGPDHYLDCRQPEWASYEDDGLIRFERPLGSRTALVLMDDECVEAVTILQARAHRRPQAHVA
jgi:hypothetical protein